MPERPVGAPWSCLMPRRPGRRSARATCAALGLSVTAMVTAACAQAPVSSEAASSEARCHDTRFEGIGMTVCEAHAGEDLRLWLNDPEGDLIGTFRRVGDQLAEGEALVFAMNAGMYHADRAPVGLYVENGTEHHPIVTSEGPGNFGLLPNGVFCIADTLRVIETRAFAEERPACRQASQSGPMLVIDGQLHPRFLPDSDSENIRNGVGVSAEGDTAWFVISDAPVNFHRFARFFRDELGARDALYFDGKISRLTVPAQGRSDLGLPMGPIIGLVERADAATPDN